MKKIILSVLLLITPVVIFLLYMGAFTSVEFKKEAFDSREIVYDIHQGSYSNLKQSWERFERGFNAAGLDNCQSLGVYLDSPDTPEDKLRTIMACDLTGVDVDIQNQLRQKFKSTRLPEAMSYSTVFPFKNEMSFMLGAIRVYPAYQELIEKDEFQPSVAIEFYGPDKGRKEIHFYMPVNKSLNDYQELVKAFE